MYTKEFYRKQMEYICDCMWQGKQHGLHELVVDNFAGGGGASTGIELATGYSVDIAVNHDPGAIRMHMANHPSTRHYCESVWDVNPLEVCKGNPVGLAWFSPDCKHFSKAKGSKPVDKTIRGLAWVALRWAGLVRPRVIMLENVEEFQTWGPLRPIRDKVSKRVLVKDSNSTSGYRIAAPGEVVPAGLQLMEPDPEQKGKTFRKFIHQLEELGYKVDFTELVAADYGAPTKRKRFFMIARCDGMPIVWPEPTHAPRHSEEVLSGKKKPYVPASDIIDWSLPCKSIFDRKKPLAENTLKRIAKGLQKFVFDNPEPFIVQVNHSGSGFRGQSIEEPLPTLTSKHGFGIVMPYIEKTYGGNYSGPGKSVTEPIHTITSVDHNRLIEPILVPIEEVEEGNSQVPDTPVEEDLSHYQLVNAFIDKYCQLDGQEPPSLNVPSDVHGDVICSAHILQAQGQSIGTDIREPLNTMTGVNHMHEVTAFMVQYYGNSSATDISEPLNTITTRDRFGLVEIHGVKYQIVDIGLRMLEPYELYRGQGFPDDYVIDRDITGKHIGKSEQTLRCGNSVCPPVPAMLVKVNLPELCKAKRMPICRSDRLKTDDFGQLKFA